MSFIMKKIANYFLTLSSIILISGCASTSSQQAADHGPSPINNKSAIDIYLDRNLKDPDSLKDFEILTEPKKGFVNYGAFETGPTGKNFSNAMWYVCIEYRAKNSFGAYTGLETEALFFFNDKVIRSVKGMTGGGDLGNTVYSCY